tara:strand:+ start:257 stop:373 length:117 start_codon:yes stop_codon:yes gene_type:complete
MRLQLLHLEVQEVAAVHQLEVQVRVELVVQVMQGVSAP